MPRILVVSPDVIGERMAGSGIRATEIARILASEHRVSLAAPPPVPVDSHIPVYEMGGHVMRELLAHQDVVITSGALPVRGLGNRQRLVVDLYDPFLLENLQLYKPESAGARTRIHARDIAILTAQIRRGDYFICASERQRHFWMGALTALFRVNPSTYEQDPTLRSLIDVVPFGVTRAVSRRKTNRLRNELGIRTEDVVVIWGGGLWNWLDPLTLIRAMAAATHQLSSSSSLEPGHLIPVWLACKLRIGLGLSPMN